jgi:polar amino acid transport system substrate-binding protein
MACKMSVNQIKKTKSIVRNRRKMKGKRVIAGILLAGILAVTLAGCKNTDNTKEESEKPVITLGQLSPIQLSE